MSEEKIIPGGISCREVVELVTDYLEGALQPEVQTRFAKHLELCPPCVEYVDQIRTTSRLASAAEFEERPDADALLSAFRSFWASS
jgi:predicted anti-sigma-YlaC factor YlaD